MINILRMINGFETDSENGLVHSIHASGLRWQLSYCKCPHVRAHDGRGGDADDGGVHKVQRVRKDSSGRSKETYRLSLEFWKW